MCTWTSGSAALPACMMSLGGTVGFNHFISCVMNTRIYAFVYGAYICTDSTRVPASSSGKCLLRAPFAAMGLLVSATWFVDQRHIQSKFSLLFYILRVLCAILPFAKKGVTVHVRKDTLTKAASDLLMLVFLTKSTIKISI